MWDVWIHILGIWVECACWEAGGPSVPPLRRRRGKPGRRVQEAAPYKRGSGGTMCAPNKRGDGNLAPHPPQCAHWGTCPYPLCPFGTSSLPLLAFGHFPLTGGIGPLTRGVGPPGGRLRDRWEHPSLHRIYKRLCIQEKGQVLDLPLKTQRRNAVSQKVLLPTFLSRKVGGRNFSQKLPCFSPLLSNLIRKCKFSFRRLDTAPLGEYYRNDTNLRQNTGRRGGGRLGPGEVCHAAKIFRRGPSRFL